MSTLHKALILSLGSVLAFAQAGASGQSGAGQSGSTQSGAGQTGSAGSQAGQAGRMSGQGGSQSGSDHMASAGSSKSSSKSSLSGGDRKFIEHAAEGGKEEVALGKLAVERASNPEVKAFGQMMVDDHSKANTELESLAQQKGITLPAGKADSNQSKLSGLSGEQFDRAYIAMMVTDHQKDVAEFEKVSRNASDPDVKAFAAKTLPTLQAHKDRVNALKSSMGGGSRMSSNGGSGTGSAVNNGGNNVNSGMNAGRDAKLKNSNATPGSNGSPSGATGNGSSTGASTQPHQ